MRRLFSKETVVLIFAGFTLFFFTAQISIFQVTFHVGDSGVTFIHREQTVAKLIHGTRAFVVGKSCIQTPYKYLFSPFITGSLDNSFLTRALKATKTATPK